MIEVRFKGDTVLCGGKPYMIDATSDPPGFYILCDVHENKTLVHESKIEDNGILAAVEWANAKKNSK
jgi:hypothetical protein